jgi:hypothetical protein
MPHEDQTAEPQLDLSVTPEAGGIPPEAGGLPPEMAGIAPEMGGEPQFDLDSLMSEIDGQFVGEEPRAPQETPMQQAPRSPQEIADAMRAAREAYNSLDEEEDAVSSRFKKVEGDLARIQEERDALRAEKVRDSINNTINITISDELTRLEIDPTTGPGKAFSRLLANSAMVAVAKEQTRTGNTQVDLRSVQQTVGKYAQLLERIAQEVASRSVSKQRMAASGSAKAPITPSKPVGEMNDKDFDAAVFAALRG